MRLFAALVSLLLALALPARAEEITVFAAASLKTALDEIAADWQAHTGDSVVPVYGGASALARQIVAGAPADIFISASEPWMDEVEAAGLLRAGSRRDLLGNDLVLIGHGAAAPMRSIAELPDRLGTAPLAMALVDSVPAGIYGRQALQAAGLWQRLEPQVAQTADVRAALALVATGAAPYGITYASDVLADPRVSTVLALPADSHDPIVYPAAQIGEGPAAARFLDALSAPGATAVFRRNGFAPLP